MAGNNRDVTQSSTLKEPLIEQNGLTGSGVPDEATTEQLVITRQAYLAIFALTCGSFALGTNEFAPLSFLPQIADTYSISIPTTAWVTSSFMIGCAVSSPLMAAIATKIDRKYLLVSLQSLLAVAATTCALSPNFSVLIVGRVLSSISQAAYVGVGAVAAADLVPDSQKGHASSLFFSGLALANIAGVPLDTLLGNQTQWRYAFWPVVGLAGLSALGILSSLPKIKKESKTNLTQELAIFKKPEVWFAFLTSTFGYAGMLASHTYFTEMMINLAGYSDSDIFWLTILYGAGAVMGNFAGGKAADINLLRSVSGLLATLAVVLFLFTLTVDYKIPAAITLFANGFTGFSLITPLMRYTISKAPGGENLAGASNISAFGVGISLGIIFSGLTIEHGYGYRSPNWVGGSLTTTGLVFFFLGEYQNKLKAKINESGLTTEEYSVKTKRITTNPILLFAANSENGKEKDKITYHDLEYVDLEPNRRSLSLGGGATENN